MSKVNPSFRNHTYKIKIKKLEIFLKMINMQLFYQIKSKLMKLKKLFWNRNNAIKTFPISHILLLAISTLLICEIYGSFDGISDRLLLALWFAFLLSCLWPIFLIHSDLRNKNTINRTLQVLAIILWAIYYFIISKIDNLFNATYSESLIYFWVIILAGILIPLLIATLHRKEEAKIWFSWTSLLTSLIFWWIAWSIVRWGIAWAFWSIEALFDVNIDSDRYAYIWVLSEVLLAWSFVFNYYLTLVENINQNKSEFKIEPSRIRRIFWTFIFLPLALIYLLIFWAYWVKILITGVRPRWIIVWLWIGYFVLGTISLDMNYPDKTKTHEVINKILYISFILIALMMIWAIYKRIDQYWITINRWFICYIIAFIIIFSALSLIFNKKRLLSFISTLFILCLLAIYWPLSASNISFKSQTSRLTTILSKENISLPLSEWVLENIDTEQTKSILWVIDELTQNYNSNKIVNKIISYDYSNQPQYQYRSNIRNYLKVDESYAYYPPYKYRRYDQYEGNSTIDVAWFSKILYFMKYYEDIQNMTFKLKIDNDEYKFDLSDYLEELKEKADIYAKSSLTEEEKKILQNPAIILEEQNYKVVIDSFSIEENREWEPHFTNIEWYILIK